MAFVFDGILVEQNAYLNLVTNGSFVLQHKKGLASEEPALHPVEAHASLVFWLFGCPENKLYFI